jgi:hypothetical protein
VQVIQQVSGTAESFSNTCTSLSVSGPDASSITVTSFVEGCLISGLPQGFTWTLTPVNDVCEYTGSPNGGGPGTPCPDYTSDNSDVPDTVQGEGPGLLLGADYAVSNGPVDTAMLVSLPGQQPYPGEGSFIYTGGDFIWTATAPTS